MQFLRMIELPRAAKLTSFFDAEQAELGHHRATG
jgi:hypothetical protein